MLRTDLLHKILIKSDEYYDELLKDLDTRFYSFENIDTYIPTHRNRRDKTKPPRKRSAASIAALVAFNKSKQQSRIHCIEGQTHDYKLMGQTKSPNGKLIEKCTICNHRRTALGAPKLNDI